MIMKNKYVLNIKGHVENNNSYYEEYNSNYLINSELLLEEFNAICKLGYKIKIHKVYDGYIELMINEQEVFELRPNETKYLISKDITTGRNENFKIDKELLYVELKEIDVSKIRHVLDYKDYGQQIDKNINKIKAIISNKEMYFDIYNELKIFLFKLTDEKYVKRIINSHNIDLINEYNNLKKYKDIIKETIDNIDNFKKENIKVIDGIIKNQIITERDYQVIINYLYQLSDSNYSYDHIPFDRLEEFLDVVCGYNKIESDNDYTLLHYYLTKIVTHHRYYFKHAYLAHRVSFNIRYENLKGFSNQELYDMMITAGDFLLMQYNRKDAMECYLVASEIALKENHLKKSAYALQKYYKINSQFPENLKEKVDVEKIKEVYKEYAEIVLLGVNYKGLKVDEIEFTDVFVNGYKYVMIAVEEEIDIVGDLHIPYQRWNLMEKYYLEKYNIVWKNPKLMNPMVMFD